MARPRAADDFAAIRARMEELQRQRIQRLRDEAAEPSDDARRYPRGRNPEPVDKPELGPFRGRRPSGR